MAFKVDMTATDLDKQIDLLRHFPQMTDKYYRPVVKGNVRALSNIILPRIPVATGKARATFGSKVTGKGMRITGRVGWYDGDDPWYPNVLEYGARPHPLNKGSNVRTKKRNFYFKKYMNDPNRIHGEGTPVLIGNRWVTIEIHPGFSARGFMAAGFSAIQPILTAELAAANEAILNNMGVK